MSKLTPEMQAELDKLRDIRLPDPVGWWPPAPEIGRASCRERV